MIKCCVVVLALLPGVCFAYPIDVQKQLDDTDILVTAHDTAPDMAAVTLQNYGARAAQCSVRFRNGPEPVRTRRSASPQGRRPTRWPASSAAFSGCGSRCIASQACSHRHRCDTG